MQQKEIRGTKFGKGKMNVSLLHWYYYIPRKPKIIKKIKNYLGNKILHKFWEYKINCFHTRKQ